jgi:tetratricopeptide (TPR) repeat protein
VSDRRDIAEPGRLDPRPAILTLSGLAFAGMTAFIILYAHLGGPFVADMEKSIGEVLLADGIRLENATDFDNAIQTYRLAVESRFTHQENKTEALRRLGTLLGWREGPQEGLPYLEEAYRNGDFSIWLYEPFCSALFDVGRVEQAFELAEEWYGRAIQEDRSDHQARAKNMEGKCLLKLGDKQLALDAFLEGHAIQPGGSNACQAGILYYEMGDSRRALQFLELFLRDADGPQAEYARTLRDRIREESK